MSKELEKFFQFFKELKQEANSRKNFQFLSKFRPDENIPKTETKKTIKKNCLKYK
jgi:hypothetical protein